MTDLNTLSTSTALELVAEVEMSLCVGAGGSSGSLADKPLLRTADGRLVIPASQVKGRLRHQCERIARSLGWPVCESPKAQTMCPQWPHTPNGHCLICRIFGNPALPSRVLFSDLVCAEPQETVPTVLRPGVTINRRRGTAEDARLYFLETTPVRAGLKFVGSLHILQDVPSENVFPQDDPPQTRMLLSAGLTLIDALGGSKSAGLGWVRWTFDALQAGETLDWSLLRAGGVQ
jgi:CRISPR/Cas system CSM-associated protein Csm3 (group 7 of RAMP superfamily)